MAVAMMDDARFWDKLARRYAAQPVSDMAGYERSLDRTRSYLKAEDRVLEIGCGTGSTALRLVDACGSMLATDFSPEMIAIAREKGADVQNLQFEVADTRLEGQEAASFDVVTAFNLLHLVPDLDAGLRRAAEVLKPGGYLIAKTPCLGADWYLRPVIKVMQLLGKAPFLSYFRPAALHAKLEAAGFEVIEVAEHNKGTRGHFTVARKR